MKYLEVKGAKVPALGFGTEHLLGEAGVRAVRCALEVGYRHIDTAARYGNEAAVGRAIRQSGVAREELFLVTKVREDHLDRAAVGPSLEASLRQLGTDYVDLLLIHWPNDAVPLGETLEAFGELRAAGKARHIGVANFTMEQVEEAVERHGADLLTNQVEHHVLAPQNPLRNYLCAQDMMLTAHSPFAGGVPHLRFNLAKIAGKGYRRLARHGGKAGRYLSKAVRRWLAEPGNPLCHPGVAHHPVLGRIGAPYGKTAAQVALRWLIEQDGVSAIPRTGNQRRCRENFEIFDFALSDEDRTTIASLAAGMARWKGDPNWTGPRYAATPSGRRLRLRAIPSCAPTS